MYSEQYILERQIELEIQALENQKAQIDLRLEVLEQNKQALIFQKTSNENQKNQKKV
jgi:hypothetical protein